MSGISEKILYKKKYHHIDAHTCEREFLISYYAESSPIVVEFKYLM